MNTDELAQRIHTLESIEAIKKLKARYCALCDNQYDADSLAELFTEDAVWDGGGFGRHEGREAIRKFFQSAPEIFPFAIHNVMNPIIEIDGVNVDTATGQWYIFQACTLAKSNQAAWLAGRYNEKYEKQGGEWKFKHLTASAFFFTPYGEGWVKKPFIGQ